MEQISARERFFVGVGATAAILIVLWLLGLLREAPPLYSHAGVDWFLVWNRSPTSRGQIHTPDLGRYSCLRSCWCGSS